MSDIIGSEQGQYAMAKPGGAIAAIELNQEVNMFGSSFVNLTGTSMETFPPVKDATGPKADQQAEQEEEEEGSWWGNLGLGSLVTGALAGAAVAVGVLTGGVGFAVIALAGAAVGAGVVTGGVAYSDAKSGHARTTSQFAGELAMGSVAGATSAASIYGMWTVLPAASQAAGIQASMWMGTASSFTASTVPTLATYGGYGVMAANGAFALNEINTIGTGQNVMCEQVFHGDVGAYQTAGMVSGMMLMGYTQVGAQNAALGTNGGKNTKSTTDGGKSGENGNANSKSSENSGGKSSGGGNQGIKMEPEKTKANLGNKADYLFGKAVGNKHNIERSKAMQAELQKIGIHDTPSGREYISNHLNNVIQNSNNISNIETRTYIAKELPGKPVVEYTATTRESLLMGPGGAVKVESVWEGNRLITVVVKGGN